ncbi:hypothetical protein L208DRAFT_304254 [Tricholoma matsutake]|nr:hypothetical protein L208DRAFT_304254 [Tricholoma matsutake 945]
MTLVFKEWSTCPEIRCIRNRSGFPCQKHRLAVDAWGRDDTVVMHIYDSIIQLVRGAVSDESKLKLYPRCGASGSE